MRECCLSSFGKYHTEELFLCHLAEYHLYRMVCRGKAAKYFEVVFIPPARCASEVKLSFSASLLCQRDISWDRLWRAPSPLGRLTPAASGSILEGGGHWHWGQWLAAGTQGAA